jgi:hypothetical protein
VFDGSHTPSELEKSGAGGGHNYMALKIESCELEDEMFKRQILRPLQKLCSSCAKQLYGIGPSLQRAVLYLSLILIWQPADAIELRMWQDLTNEADISKVVQLLKVYGVVPTRLLVIYFDGLRDAIGGVSLFRTSKDPDCVQQHTCWYVLMSDNFRDAPIVTACEFQGGSLAHHFHADRSNFFVFDFTCSGARMQIQMSNGHLFVAADPTR